MSTRRRSSGGPVAALSMMLLVGLLAGCGHSQEDVEKSFLAYHAALLARDFPTACSYNTPEATAKLLASLRTQGIEATSCERGFAALYAESGGSAAADGVGNSVQVREVTVEGDRATVQWTAVLGTEPRPATSVMRYADGKWQFVAG